MKQSEEREYNIARVIQAAQDLFVSDGIYATSINRIAQEANLSPMSVYRYFKNKDTLVYTVWQDALAKFYQQYMTRYSVASVDCRTGFEKYVVAMDIYSQIYRESPRWYAYTQEMFSYSPAEESSGKEIINVFWQYYDKEIPVPALKALKEGVEDGSIRPDVNIYTVYQCLLNAYTGTSIYENVSFGVSPVDIIEFTGTLIANYIKNTK
jgi:AcrR family transcriptional regulator